MSRPPPMKFWEAVSAFREFPDVLAEVFGSDKWRTVYGETFSRWEELVNAQDRAALDEYLPLELTREIAKRCQGLTFGYSAETGHLWRMPAVFAQGLQTMMLSALDVHDRFGGSVIEEVLERGSARVMDLTD